MATKIYRKLVRDNIPNIIKSGGASCTVRTLDPVEYAHALRVKLVEEADEAASCGSEAVIEELADVLEVVYALAAAFGATPSEIEAARSAKSAARGGFSQRIFLESVTGP